MTRSAPRSGELRSPRRGGATAAAGCRRRRFEAHPRLTLKADHAQAATPDSKAAAQPGGTPGGDGEPQIEALQRRAETERFPGDDASTEVSESWALSAPEVDEEHAQIVCGAPTVESNREWIYPEAGGAAGGGDPAPSVRPRMGEARPAAETGTRREAPQLVHPPVGDKVRRCCESEDGDGADDRRAPGGPAPRLQGVRRRCLRRLPPRRKGRWRRVHAQHRPELPREHL